MVKVVRVGVISVAGRRYAIVDAILKRITTPTGGNRALTESPSLLKNQESEVFFKNS